MKGFDRIIAVFAAVTAAMFAAVNITFAVADADGSRLHIVEANRVARAIEETGEIPDISGCETVTGVYVQSGDDSAFFASDPDNVIIEAGGRLYRIEYKEKTDRSYILRVNIILAVFAASVIGLLAYIRQTVIRPFLRISELPAELAKGNLTVPLKEQKNRSFGKFLWGLDMLREKLEQSKRSELELQKEKKTMLMSLSHDIKTPLSAIKLYSAALSKGIYTDPEKRREAADSINAKADEIEKLVNEIIHANTEDIMSFDVKDGEFYLSGVIDGISSYYRDKLTGTEFVIGRYDDCIIKGDPDRLTEVLQNIIENAVKYGDGSRIGLSFSEEEDCRLITVTNSGCTLPESELAHIFESFRRGSNVGSKPGSGLGLYICRQLMSAMNGDIFAEIHGGDMSVTVVCRKT